MQIKPIAHIYTDFNEKFGIPRQSGRVKDLIAKIVFEKEFRSPESLRGIEGFSHLWLVFDFSQSHRQEFSPTVRPPRLGGNQRVGVFASRSPFRPNSLGLSSVKLVNIENNENEGFTLIVSGADLLNGTPIYDIKPYLPSTDCHVDAVGGYAEDFTDYKLTVKINDGVLENFPKDKLNALLGCLEQDPRPSYQDDDRVYGMNFAGYNISFTVKKKILTVIDCK